MEPVTTKVYSIKDLEHLSGIKAHTIRMWEQRYDLFSPERTATNIRYYDDEDLKLILNIATLKNHGFKISKIVAMNKEELEQERRGLLPKSCSIIWSVEAGFIDRPRKMIVAF